MGNTKLWLINIGIILLTSHFGASQERTQWCDEHDHDHDHDHDHYDEEHDHYPHPDEFLVEIFHLYGDNLTCTISEHEFEHLLIDLAIGGDDGHAHEHSARRRRRSVVHECYTAEDLLNIYNISHEDGIAEDEFVELSPSLIQQIVQGCAHHDHGESVDPTAWETFGYGTISVVLISLCAPLGLVVVRWADTPAYKYIMATMLGLAIGTLSGDALIHLIPHGLDVHGHGDEGGHDHDHGDGVDESVWKMFLSCVAIWGFFNLQAALQTLSGGHSHSHDAPVQNQVAPMTKAVEISKDVEMNGHQNGHITQKENEDELNEEKPTNKSLALMVTVGDGFHNFADGLAIGAAYTIDWQTGLSTSLAVLIHELAHEFGDVAALLSTGINWRKVFFIQLLTQTPALLGLYIGIPIAESSESAQQWILCLAAGMFLYIALCDIVPELMDMMKKYSPWKFLAAINLGLGLGFFIMLLIGAFEGSISL